MGSACCKSKNAQFEPSNLKSIKVQPANIAINKSDGIQSDYIEDVVCQEDDVQENEMQTFDLGDSKVLIVKQNGKISAIGTKCSHNDAPLVTGALGEGRIRCSWHGACFKIATGDIEDFPGLDSIPCYKVRVEKGQVFVRAKKSELQSNKRTLPMVKRDLHDSRVFVVIGGGPSGATSVENLRVEGFTGRIILLCSENVLPYDRVKLSKAFDAEPALLRSQQFYDDNHIEVMCGVAATSLNTQDKVISTSKGDNIKYDKVFIATGSSARRPKFPGDHLKNIFVVRQITDANELSKSIDENSHVVVFGGSFTGMETASILADKVAKVTVIEHDSVPLKVFGSAVGERVMKYFEERKVEFVMKSDVMECLGDSSGKIHTVVLENCRHIKADVLVLGMGSTLNTEFLKDSGIIVNANGSIDTNEFLESNIPDVYVGGDIANSPIYTGNRETIGHFGIAQYHGKIAAINMCGTEAQKLKAVPFFWTVLFGRNIKYAGHGKAVDVRIEGSLEEMKFVAFYFSEVGRVIAVSSCSPTPIVAEFAEFLSQGKVLTREEVEKDPFGWSSNKFL